MRFIERLIEFLFPTALINQTMWRTVWDRKERANYLVTARIFFVVAGAGYVCASNGSFAQAWFERLSPIHTVSLLMIVGAPTPT